MKHIKLILISMASLALGRPLGMCTSNGVADDLEAFKAETAAKQAESDQKIAELAAQNADLQKQLAEAKATNSKSAPREDNSTLAILCRHHGVEMDDVRWRIAAGLTDEQAVQAAAAQKQFDESPEGLAHNRGVEARRVRAQKSRAATAAAEEAELA